MNSRYPFVAICFFHFVSGFGKCTFKWADTWLQKEREFEITEKNFGMYGECSEKRGDLFVVRDNWNPENCGRCIIILTDEPNIIQYKISRCVRGELGINDCSKLFDGNIVFHTLFRKNAKAVNIPLKLPISFNYTGGRSGSCHTEASTITRCSKRDLLSLNFQTCPENPKKETSIYEMEVIGSWKFFRQDFFAARMTNMRGVQHRCFVYVPSSSTTGRIGISADAGCQEMANVPEAAIILRYKEVADIESFCEFPGYMWKHDHRKWKYDWVAMSSNKNHRVHRGSWHSHYREQNDTVWTCLDRKDKDSEHYFRVHVQKGCQTGYQCMKVKRLRKHIIEVHYGQLNQEEFFDDCSDMEVTQRDTLVIPGHKESCSPKHRLYTPSCPDVPAISLGCQPEKLQVLRKCSDLQTESFECVGHFDDQSQKLTIIRSEETGQLMCMAHMLNPINLVRIFDFRACTADAIEGEPPSVFMNISRTEHCHGSLLAGFLSSSSSISSTSLTTLFVLKLCLALTTHLFGLIVLV